MLHGLNIGFQNGMIHQLLA